ncbi:MFS transporter [Saccharopolyspora aridisoli]|uniref:MFS transporter n=1 Tax=Saccharopolyspora aridisoli TaxID=2530385 RepID=A0A4V2Y7X5_9PSEU|nr:MFS transporter [Saccharopolyspora aridisoli]TDC93775.1 MFS transporter [Saccharopolyspora aridisoli]
MTLTAPARSRWTRTGLYVLVVLTVGAYLPSPLLPGYQDDFGFGDLTMTLIYATFALVSAPALLLLGTATDVVGPRSVLRASLIAGAVASLCFALASSPLWLVAGRAAQGVALGTATGAASVLISQNARERAALLASTAFVAGTAAGPIVGGVLAEHAPAPFVLPFLLHLVALGYGWSRVSALPASAPGGRWRPSRPRVPAGMRAVFGLSAATGFLAWTAVGLFLSLIPALLDRAGHTDLAVSGCVLGAVLICSVLTQPLVSRWGAHRAQLLGLCALFVSLVLLALAGGGTALVTLIAAVTAGAGHGLAYGGATAAVERTVPPAQRGAITGALYLAFYLGAGCPAIAVGLIALGEPLGTATSWVAIAAAGLVLLTLLVTESLAPGRSARQHRRNASGRATTHFTSAERGGGRRPGARPPRERGASAARPILGRRAPRTGAGGPPGAGGAAQLQRQGGPGDAASSTW